ncbi:MAG TPA: hypothetical protein VNQ74_17080, partial [Burkholderiaceae bacterium]|nr:hypothetical protein [Burkholderiaceae bacterium]
MKASHWRISVLAGCTAFGLLSAIVATTTLAAEKLPDGMKLVRIEAQPAAIELNNPFAYRQLLLTGVLENGDRLDVTRMAQPVGTAEIVQVSDGRLVRPKADGASELRFELAGHSVAVPVKVSGTTTPYNVSFVRDVMPAMSKLGCNAGTCHGAAKGKAGFKLSLRGYDPVTDHLSLTDDLAARRFNPAAPEQSLMLLKPSGSVPHVGGVLTKPGEPSYELLKMWIAGSAKLDA